MPWLFQLHPHHEVFDDFLQLVHQMPLLDELEIFVFVGQAGKLSDSANEERTLSENFADVEGVWNRAVEAAEGGEYVYLWTDSRGDA